MIRRHRGLPAFIPVLLLLTTMSPRPRGAPPIEVVPGRKQLFLDDFVVAKTTGLNKTMHHPKKRGAVVRPDTPADGWGAICLAVLRRDGFVSYHAGQNVGFLRTRPWKLGGRDLYVNLETTDGNARVEILDEADQPIRDYSLSEAVALTGDKVRQRVAWNENPSLRELVGRTVRFKFQLRHANLFAFWTE